VRRGNRRVVAARPRSGSMRTSKRRGSSSAGFVSNTRAGITARTRRTTKRWPSAAPKIRARVFDLSRTPVIRQVSVKELRNDLFLKVLRVQPALAHPPARVNKAPEVSSLGRRCIAVVAEISLVG